MMDRYEIRQWAIDRAIECNREDRAANRIPGDVQRAVHTREQHADRVLAVASMFHDFVMGTNDAEILRAARELADKVKD